MRAVSVILFVSMLGIAAPASGQAQAPSHTDKTTTKAGAASKTGHAATTAQAAAASKAKSNGRAAHTAPVKAAAAAPVLEAARPDAGALAPVNGTTLRDAPDGQSLAALSPHVVLEAVARDRGWVRVRAEGWVKESDVAPVDSTRTVLSAADLRTDPDGARGKHVRWDVEVLAMATADPLRKGLNPDEPYLLARGPGVESALLYVAIPPAMLTAARALASQAPVPVTLAATVRVGRSEPVGVPILDAQSLARR
jgi:hypothetical protein